MLDQLRAVGVAQAVVVVAGHDVRQVRAVVAHARRNLRVQVLEDPDPARGSAMALYQARDFLGAGPSLILGSGVVFPRALLRRLVEAPAANALLCDGGDPQTGERVVRIYTRAERVVAIGRQVVPTRWDAVGTGVGFAKLGASAGVDLASLLEEMVASRGSTCDCDAALHLLAGQRLVRAVDITGVPWADVDQPEGLRRAERVIVPMIQELDGAA
jgi:choline kinase